jgi:hypothetical protein
MKFAHKSGIVWKIYLIKFYVSIFPFEFMRIKQHCINRAWFTGMQAQNLDDTFMGKTLAMNIVHSRFIENI